MKSLVIFAILITVTWARPQSVPAQQRFPTQQFPPQRFPIQQFPGQIPNNIFFPGNTNNNNNDGNVVTSTAAPPTTAGTVTTASPQYLACLQSCPSTMEYNPVCGTDNQNYHNNGRLSCAQRCGKNVAALRLGTCAPL